jgi:hypothetical protein
MKFKHSTNIEGPERNALILGLERIKKRPQPLDSNRAPPPPRIQVSNVTDASNLICLFTDTY